MDVQLVPPSVLVQAQKSIEIGGDGVREGVAELLIGIGQYAETEGVGGANCAYALTCALRRLHDDAYLTLGIPVNGADADVKRAYRKLALRFHPDKNRATSSLFQAIQGAYDVLSDPEKRPAYDEKRRRQQAALAKLRKQHPHRQPQPHRQAGTSSQQESSPQGADPCTKANNAKPSTSFQRHQSPAENSQEKMREFNKRFYAEFRKAAQTPEQKPNSTSAATAGVGGQDKERQGGSSVPGSPPRPKMRSIGRTDSAVTLEWSRGALPVTTAYELQWRPRGRVSSEWITSPTFIVGTQCRKKNLQPCTCYEFRIRAASAWGWSTYSDAVMVVTLAGGADDLSSAGSAQRQKVNGFRNDDEAAGGAQEGMAKAKAQVQEARHRRDAERRASSRHSGSSGAAAHEAAARLQQKTNSWYWRRMSAAAGQPAASNGEKTGTEGPTSSRVPANDVRQYQECRASSRPHRRKTHAEGSASKAGVWTCVVCKRTNEGSASSCWVCYTARSYRSNNLSRISVSRGGVRAAGPEAGIAETVSDQRSARNDGGKLQSTSTPVENESEKLPTITPASGGIAHSPTNSGYDAASPQNDTQEGMQPDRIPSIRVYSHTDGQVVDTVHFPHYLSGSVISLTARPPTHLTEQFVTQHQSSSDANEVPTTDTGIRVIPADGVSPDKLRPSDPDDVWECTEDDIFSPPSGPASPDSSDGEDWSYMESASAANGPNAATPVWLLNASVTMLHNVRKEPLADSPVIGHLHASRPIRVLAEVGNWCKVEYHTPVPEDSGRRSSDLCGWCVRENESIQYLVPSASLNMNAEQGNHETSTQDLSHQMPKKKTVPPKLEEGIDEELWYELHDDEGAVYYFNSASGESQWEPPQWVDEIDPVSGAVYYVNSLTGDAQWEMPERFVPVIRENPYQSTPKAEFMKSVLSPKRSKGAMSFKKHLERTRLGLSCSIHRMKTMMEERLGADDASATELSNEDSCTAALPQQVRA